MARLLFLQNLEYEFLGPMYISSILKSHGHVCSLVVGQELKQLAGEIEVFAPDLIGFSIMSGSHNWARDMAIEIRKHYGIPCIFGGAHPTFFPDFAREEGVQLIVRGEGEEAVLEILNRIDKGLPYNDVANTSVVVAGELIVNPLRNLRGDLDDYPFPDRRLYDALEGRLDRGVRNVITSRGCPFHCSFCFEDAMRDLYAGKGKYVRIRHIDKVIEECRAIKRETDVRVIYFADDVFGMSKRWLYDFLPVYKREIGLPFICLVRADITASDPNYAKALADAGCRSVFFGVESGNEELRNRVLVKQLTDQQIEDAARLLHEAGIPFRTYNIVGLPDETLEDAFSTVELNIRIKANYPWCSVFSPFPGTALTKYAVQKGMLDEQFAFTNLSKSFFLDSKLNLPHRDELANLQKFFQTAVLWPITLPLIKRLIRLRPNLLFTWWFGFVYFLVYIRSEQRRPWQTLMFAFRNAKHVLARQ